MVAATNKTKVFLSYDATDKDFARHFSEELARQGFSVWDDRQVLPGENWHEAVGEALNSSEAMVVLISPEAMQSQAVRREIDFALASEQYAGKLISVILRPTDDAPWILNRLQIIRASRSRGGTVAKTVAKRLRDAAEAQQT